MPSGPPGAAKKPPRLFRKLKRANKIQGGVSKRQVGARGGGERGKKEAGRAG